MRALASLQLGRYIICKICQIPKDLELSRAKAWLMPFSHGRRPKSFMFFITIVSFFHACNVLWQSNAYMLLLPSARRSCFGPLWSVCLQDNLKIYWTDFYETWQVAGDWEAGQMIGFWDRSWFGFRIQVSLGERFAPFSFNSLDIRGAPCDALLIIKSMHSLSGFCVLDWKK